MAAWLELIYGARNRHDACSTGAIAPNVLILELNGSSSIAQSGAMRFAPMTNLATAQHPQAFRRVRLFNDTEFS
jgi:hypothetical protein